MNRIAIVEDDQGYRDTLFTYIKQYRVPSRSPRSALDF